MISVASIVVTVNKKVSASKAASLFLSFFATPRGLPLPISVPGPREAVHGPSGPFLWYFWPPPLMVLLTTPLMDLSSTHLADSLRTFVFRFLALAREVPYV